MITMPVHTRWRHQCGDPVNQTDAGLNRRDIGLSERGQRADAKLAVLYDAAQSDVLLTKGKNVTVNSVLPGPTWTEGVENYFGTLAEEEGKPIEELTKNYFADHEPSSLLQRFVEVAEVAEATVYLTSNRAMNGQGLRVEGGIIRAL